METIDLKEFCAPGAAVHESLFDTSSGVKLKLITFTPARDEGKLPVVFVPGWISRMAGWKIILREMTATRVVHYLETREKISSLTPPDADQSVEAIAGDICDYIHQNHFKRNQYLLFGSSLGATAILQAAPDIQETPAALILIGPNAVFRVPIWGKAVIRLFPPRFYEIFKIFIKWYLKTFRLNVRHDQAQYDKYAVALDIADPYKLKKSALSLSTYQVWERLPHIDIPVLLINAGKDNLHEPQNINRMYDLLRNVDMVDMETNTGTHSAQMVRTMDDFVSGLTGPVPEGNIPAEQ